TVVPFLILGLVVGTYTLPIENQDFLNLFKVWGLPFVELFVLTYITLKIRASIKKYKEKAQSNPDFFTTLKETCAELLPEKIVPFFATEIAVIYYGFVNWKKCKFKENEFSYHKNNGTPVLLITVIFLVIIETFVI